MAIQRYIALIIPEFQTNTMLRRGLIRLASLPQYTHGQNIRFSSSLKDRKIGVIGLGMVGKALIKNLTKAGYSVTTILDINTDMYKLFPELQPAESPQQLAQVIISSTTQEHKP